jgi:UDP-N-acetylmuramate--alanine ligase
MYNIDESIAIKAIRQPLRRYYMYKLNLETPINVHFIGIGGISMSALAELLIKRDFRVSGSDIGSNGSIDKLVTHGATIFRGHDESHITPDIDLIVYTVAVKQDNPELTKAHALNIPIIDRGTLLGQVMDGYQHSIGVSGTHGKTTTTSILAHILDEAKVDPTVMVGGILPLIDGNVAVSTSPYFITEACEYFNSYHHFNPEIAIILNVEEDHLDFFKDIHEIRASFNRYLQNVKEGGLVVMNADIEGIETIMDGIDKRLLTYSLEDSNCNYYATHITYNALGHGSFDVLLDGQAMGHYELSVPGAHNISNALAAIVAAKELGLDDAAIVKGLKSFGGTHRRFQYKGSLGGVNVVDDYAHHPTEIDATISATKNMDLGKLWVIFQPHTFTRTKAFLDDFAQALSKADHVILMDIYSAGREVDHGDIHSRDIQDKIIALGTPCDYFESIDEINYFVMTHCVPNDLLITMGAGDVYLVGEALLDA